MIDVHKIASLARLSVTEAEAEQYQKQMAAIFGHFEKIKSVNTDGVEPLVTPSEIEIVFRDDKALKTIKVEEAMQNSPDHMGNLFRVPPVVG